MVDPLKKLSTAARRKKTCKFMLEIFRKKMNIAMINVSVKRYVSFWSPLKNIDLEDRTTTMFRAGVNLSIRKAYSNWVSFTWNEDE